MAEKNPESIPPQIAGIPEQIIASGKRSEINLGMFVTPGTGGDEALQFSCENNPIEFFLDEHTGILSGQAEDTELNKVYSVDLTVTDTKTGLSASINFVLEIIGTLLLETDVAKAFFAKQELPFWEADKAWVLHLFIQYLIAQRYAWVMMYNMDKRDLPLGSLLSRKKALSGWDMLEFENAVMITPGGKAFENYGNRRRLLDTLREALNRIVSHKNWQTIAIEGSDEESVGKCWVVAKELGLPVEDVAPTYIAEINYYNLKKVFAGNTPSKNKRIIG